MLEVVSSQAVNGQFSACSFASSLVKCRQSDTIPPFSIGLQEEREEAETGGSSSQGMAERPTPS